MFFKDAGQGFGQFLIIRGLLQVNECMPGLIA